VAHWFFPDVWLGYDDIPVLWQSLNERGSFSRVRDFQERICILDGVSKDKLVDLRGKNRRSKEEVRKLRKQE
jgi:hypothetical protein